MGVHENKDMRERLLLAAESCFEFKGIGHTSMLDIAEAAGVSRTTLYKQFSSIEDVLKATFVREFDRFEQRLQPRLRKCRTPEEVLIEVAMGIAENAPSNSGIGSLVAGPRNKTEEMALKTGRSALNERITGMFRVPLDELEAAGRLRSDVDRKLIIEWIRAQIHTFSEIRFPGLFSQGLRRKLITKFMLYSLLNNKEHE